MVALQTSTSGLAGVWAEENTRESIFDAMKRKEVYGTSGVRIKVRMFGGWEFGPEVLKQKDWVKTGYAKGVPMGGDLPAPKAKAVVTGKGENLGASGHFPTLPLPLPSTR